jgi:hypothetical protein
VDLIVVIPSRGRPQKVAGLIQACRETCRGDTHLYFGLDKDDPALQEYLDIFQGTGYVVEDGLRRVVPWMNHLSAMIVDDYRFIGHFGDDQMPRTVGWDVRVCESLERNLFCFADDLYPGRPTGTLCCHVFMRSEVVKTLGYMGPPCMQHMYVDPTWMAWGQATSIEFLADVELEHMHYSCGKADADQSYYESTALIQQDLTAFNEYCYDQNGLNADIEKLKGIQFAEEEITRFRADLNIPDVIGGVPGAR